MRYFKRDTFTPIGEYYRVDAPLLKHLPYETIVMAVAGTMRCGLWGRMRSVIRVWNLQATTIDGKLVPRSQRIEYEQFYLGDDHFDALRRFILAINHPSVSERLTFLET